MKTISSLLQLLLICSLLSAQGITSGTITDAETGEPLIHANIVIEGDTIGTVSNIDGFYSIQNNGRALRFSYIGYASHLIENADGKVNIYMTIDATQIIECPIYIIDKRVSSAHNYTLLDTKTLNLQNKTALAPILNSSPGVFMHSGALNTNRITIRGIGSRSPFSTNKIKAYLNDIPLTNGSGETTIEDIDLSFIQNIEIWKGPSSSIYGAGLGGMILMNSIDRLPSHVSMNHSSGSFGLHRNTIDVHLNNEEKKFDLHLNHNLTSSEGYRDNNKYTRQGFTLLSNADLKEDKLHFLLNFTRLKSFIPSSLNEEDFLNEPTKAAFTWGRVKGFEDYDRILAGISYDQKISNSVKFKYALFLNSRSSYELRPFNILTENSLSTGARVVFNWIAKRDWSLKVGTELFRESYDWETFATNSEGDLLDPLSINTETRSYGNLFGEVIYNLRNGWKINGGINLNATRYNLEDRFFSDSIDISGDYSFDPIISPRLTISYTPKPNNDYYILLSHGFSPPSLEETLAPDGSINSEIQPEVAWNMEIGSRSYFENNRFNYEISLYTMLVKDLLVARRTDFDQYIGINAGKTIHNGLELHLQYNFIRYSNNQLNLQINYSYSDFTFSKFIDGEEDFSGNKLTGTAPHQLNTILFGQYKNLFGNINFTYTDTQPLRDDNSIYSEDYSLLHTKIGYHLLDNHKWKFDIYAGVNNILDKHYASMHQINASSFGSAAPRYYYPGLPRHFYAGIDLRYLLQNN